jgi:hypothetical protein
VIISQFPSGNGGGSLPSFSYTGRYEIEMDSGGWKVRFLSSGVLTMITTALIDVFIVGGGGNGLNQDRWRFDEGYHNRFHICGVGGGGGYTTTQKRLQLTEGSSYTIVVGYSGGVSSITPDDSSEWDGNSYSANGGQSAYISSGASGGTYNAGDGGSGGAPASVVEQTYNGIYISGNTRMPGGTDGVDGPGGGGEGQGTTTREFGDASGALYASGGGTYMDWSKVPEMKTNTGDGGHGGLQNYTFGSDGIVVIRNARG